MPPSCPKGPRDYHISIWSSAGVRPYLVPDFIFPLNSLQAKSIPLFLTFVCLAMLNNSPYFAWLNVSSSEQLLIVCSSFSREKRRKGKRRKGKRHQAGNGQVKNTFYSPVCFFRSFIHTFMAMLDDCTIFFKKYYSIVSYKALYYLKCNILSLLYKTCPSIQE